VASPSWLKTGYGCATHRNKGTCANSATVSRQEIEARVLTGLKDRLMAPELVREFIRAFHEEVNRAAADLEKRIKSDALEQQSLERKIASIVAAIEEGNYSRALSDRLSELERQRDLILARKVESPAPTIRVHPRLADVYAEKVQQLEEALNEPSIREEAAEVLRSLIDRVELRPRGRGQGLDALLYGDLVEILGFCGKDKKKQLPEGKSSGGQLSVVAGTCNHLDLQLRELVQTVFNQ
jgi:site-specific DNA recombinase